MCYETREATIADISFIKDIYNQGIEDRIATLETSLKSIEDMKHWFKDRPERYKVIVIMNEASVVKGYASVNVFNSRCCYSGVGDLSIYIDRNARGKGLGKILLAELLVVAKKQDFHKLVLSTFDFNVPGKKLYNALGFREVGTYINQGILDDKYVNVTIMERLL
jgi:L-amino acid N-acyltransferase YncA